LIFLLFRLHEFFVYSHTDESSRSQLMLVLVVFSYYTVSKICQPLMNLVSMEYSVIEY